MAYYVIMNAFSFFCYIFFKTQNHHESYIYTVQCKSFHLIYTADLIIYMSNFIIYLAARCKLQADDHDEVHSLN